MRYRPWCSVEVSTNDMCFCSSRAAGRWPADGRPSGGHPPYEQKTSNRFCNCATFLPKKLRMVSCVQVDTLRPTLHKNMYINERLMIFTSLGPYFYIEHEPLEYGRGTKILDFHFVFENIALILYLGVISMCWNIISHALSHTSRSDDSRDNFWSKITLFFT